MRIDVYLYTHGYAESRQKARAVIEAGRVYVNGRQVLKPSAPAKDGDNVELRGPDMPYVSRGGLKLEAAFDSFGINPSGLTAADIGASTGGFTDCLLQRGAAKVYAVDVGEGQLHPRISSDARVVVMEKFNARRMAFGDIGEFCHMVTMDVSFISQSQIYSAVSEILTEGGDFISLIKPQFEAGRAALNKRGVVADLHLHRQVIEKLVCAAQKHGLHFVDYIPSPIKGGEGNIEYLALFKKHMAFT